MGVEGYKPCHTKGQTVALVGQSGSGKSTLLDLIPRYYDVQEGEILIDGINIKDLGVHDLRQLIGNVNQEAILFNDSSRITYPLVRMLLKRRSLKLRR